MSSIYDERTKSIHCNYVMLLLYYAVNSSGCRHMRNIYTFILETAKKLRKRLQIYRIISRTKEEHEYKIAEALSLLQNSSTF